MTCEHNGGEKMSSNKLFFQFAGKFNFAIIIVLFTICNKGKRSFVLITCARLGL